MIPTGAAVRRFYGTEVLRISRDAVDLCGSSKKENLDRLRRENFIGASTTTWVRDIAKVLNRRFDPVDRDRALVLLAKKGCPIEEWKPLLLWHIDSR